MGYITYLTDSQKIAAILTHEIPAASTPIQAPCISVFLLLMLQCKINLTKNSFRDVIYCSNATNGKIHLGDTRLLLNVVTRNQVASIIPSLSVCSRMARFTCHCGKRTSKEVRVFLLVFPPPFDSPILKPDFDLLQKRKYRRNFSFTSLKMRQDHIGRMNRIPWLFCTCAVYSSSISKMNLLRD